MQTLKLRNKQKNKLWLKCSDNDQALATFTTARACISKRSDGSECGEAWSEGAKAARSVTPEAKVRRSLKELENHLNYYCYSKTLLEDSKG